MNKANDGVGYKDPYHGNYNSKPDFLKMKLRSEKTKFTKLYWLIENMDEGSKLPIRIDIKKDIGFKYVDPRLPKYVIGFTKFDGKIQSYHEEIEQCEKPKGGTTRGLISFELIKA